MRTFERYTFKLVVTNLTTSVSNEYVVHPAYDSLKMKYSRQSGEMYFKKDIGTEFTLINEDFILIHSMGMLSKFELKIYDRGTLIASGYFRKAECEFDVDYSLVKFKINANSSYNKIDAKKDDEYDLLQLGLTKKSTSYKVLPITQYYEYNTTHLVSISLSEDALINQSSVQKDGASELVGMDLNSAYTAQKALVSHTAYGRIVINAGTEYDGTYEEFKSTFSQKITIEDNSVVYYWFHNVATPSSQYKVVLKTWQLYSEEYDIAMELYIEDGNNNVVARAKNTQYVDGSMYKFYDTTLLSQESLTFDIEGAMASFRADVKLRMMLVRVVGRSWFKTTGSNYDMAKYDPLISSNAYKFFVPIVSNNVCIQQGTWSITDKGYGERPNPVSGGANYYDKPSGNYVYVPILKDCWSDNFSFWINAHSLEGIMTTMLDEQLHPSINVQCQDTYNLGDAIKALLNKIDDSIIFETTSDYSQFLFSEKNPITRQPQGDIRITPKTNIMYTGYTYPAWKAPITLSDIFEFLKNGLNCYWYIDSSNKLHIEHVKYFMNGLSYNIDPSLSIDLTTRYDAHNNRPQSYKTNNWSFNSSVSGEKQTTRIEFSWMDQTGVIFDDYPIVVPDQYRYTEEENTEKRYVSNFTSDINFIVAYVEGVSQNGFAVMQCQYQSDAIVVGQAKVGTLTINGVQNNTLSFQYIIENYMLYNIASWHVTYRDGYQEADLTAFLERVRENDVKFQFNDGEIINENSIIKTSAGNGIIESLELDLATNTAKATLKYELDIQ